MKRLEKQHLLSVMANAILTSSWRDARQVNVCPSLSIQYKAL